MSDIFQIGTSGLLAAQRALSTTGNNIANAATEGYSRQTVSFFERQPTFTGAGFIGSGVGVSDISRVFDDFASRQVTDAIGSSSQQSQLLSLGQQLDEVLANDASGLASGLNRFFDAIGDFATNPSDTATRKAALVEAESLEQTFNTLGSRFEEFRSNTEQLARNLVVDINARTSALADINVELQASANNVSPTLLDQRDQQLRELADLIGVRTVEVDNGITNVFTGTGQPLVLGSNNSELSITTADGDPSSVAVRLGVGGDATVDVTGSISGGALTGVLDFRERLLTDAENALGRIAVTVADQFNAIQTSGLDLQGNLGENLFRSLTGDTGVISVFSQGASGSVQAQFVAEGGYPRVLNGATEGTLSATVGDPSALDGGDYSFEITGLSAPDYNYTITNLNTGAAADTGTLASGDTIDFRGLSFSYTAPTAPGTPADAVGDTVAVVGAPSDRQPSDYRIDARADGSGGISYSVTRLIDGSSVDIYQAAGDGANVPDRLLFDGIEVELTDVAAGDRYTLAPYRYAPGTFATELTDPTALAAAYPVRGVSGTNNTGDGELQGLRIAGTAGLPLGGAGALTLRFDAATSQFSLLDADGSAVTDAGGTAITVPYVAADDSGQQFSIAPDGVSPLSFTLSGTPADGDSFTLRDGASGDNTNALRMEALRFDDVIDGTASLSEAYGQLVAEVGTRVRQASIANEAQQTRLDAAEARRQSISGVNLEEEAANLLQMQRAFDASARMIAVANQTFQSLLQAVRA